MSLMSLVRWIGAMLLGWTLVALGIGASGTRLPGLASTTPVPPGASSVEAMPVNEAFGSRSVLIDRADGRRTPIRLPAGEQWSGLTVAPWRGPRGELEAVGRWVNPAREDFGGWGVLRVPDGEVVCRITTEILPTGRPCWVPGQSRTILFSAADGRLYRYRLPDEEGEVPVARHHPVYASGRADPSDPLAWQASPSGPGEPMLLDPAWPADPAPRRWLLASLMALEMVDGREVFGPAQLCWLELSDDARAIVAFGRLAVPTGKDEEGIRIDRRFPNLAVGGDGRCRLIFLERPKHLNAWRLRSVALDLDARTGRPRVATDPDDEIAPPPLLRPRPLLPSADGTTVYGLSASDRLDAWPIRSPGLPVAGR